MHIQSGHHLISRFVVQKCLVLDPIVDLEIAMVWVQLDEKSAGGLTLVGLPVGDEEFSGISGEDPLVLLLRFFSFAHELFVALLTAGLRALASVFSYAQFLGNIEKFVEVLGTLSVNLLHQEISCGISVQVVRKLVSMQIAFLVEPF